MLIKDGESEKFDERRVNLLKSQLIQLERQASIRLLVFMMNAAFFIGRLTVLFINQLLHLCVGTYVNRKSWLKSWHAVRSGEWLA